MKKNSLFLMVVFFAMPFSLSAMTFADSPSGCSAIGAATYNATISTITVNNQANTLCSIFYDVNDSSVLAYDSASNTYTLNAIIKVKAGANLSINGTVLAFNNSFDGEHYLANNGFLIISGSTITTTNPDYTGYVESYVLDVPPYTPPYWFYIENSTLNHMGSNTQSKFALGIGRASSGEANHPAMPVTVKDSIIRNAKFGYLYYTEFAKTPPLLVVNNTFDNVYSTASGNAGLITLESDGFIFSHNTLKNIRASADVLFLSGYRDDSVVYNEFINVSARYTAVSKHSYNMTISNNYFHDGGSPAIVSYKGESNPVNGTVVPAFEQGDTIENNVIENYYCYWCTGTITLQYYSNESFHGTIVRNNTLRNINGTALMIQGMHDLLVENNYIFNVTGAGVMFSNNNYRGIDMTSHDITFRNNTYDLLGSVFAQDYNILPYFPLMNGSILVDEKYLRNTISNNWGVKFVDGISPGYINLLRNRSKIVSLTSPAMFFEYSYLDAKAIDINGAPVEGATIVVDNTANSSYPAININGKVKTWSVTGPGGHTDLPSNRDNSIAILERFYTGWNTYFVQNHTISAYDPFSIWTNVTHTIYPNGTIQQLQPLAQATVRPDASWYRQNPNTYQNTTTLQINYTRTNITVLPSLSQVNITVEKWNVSEVIAANFTADTAADNDVLFGIGNLKPNANYSIKKDGIIIASVQSDASGILVFNNSVW